MTCKKWIGALISILIIASLTGCGEAIKVNNYDLHTEQKNEKQEEIVNLTYTLDDKQTLDIVNRIEEEYILPQYSENYVFNWMSVEFNNEQFKEDNVLIDIYVDADMQLKSDHEFPNESNNETLEITTFLYQLEVENISHLSETSELKYNIYAMDEIGNKSSSLLTGKLNRQLVENNIKSASNLYIHFDKSIESLDIHQAEQMVKEIKTLYIEHFDKNVYEVENFNFEFNKEQNEEKIAINVSVYYDITLIRHPKESPFVLGMEHALSQLTDKEDIEIAERIMSDWLKELMPEYNTTERNVQYLKVQIDPNDLSNYELFYPYVLENKMTLYPAKEYYDSMKKSDEELKQNGEDVIKREIQ